MKKYQFLSALFLALLFTFTFSACSKDDPIPEVDQEEYSAVEVILQEGTLTDGEFVASEVEKKISFTKDGSPSPAHIHLDEETTYRMKVNLFHNGTNINQEFTEASDEHQFFFLGAPEGVLEYQYEDDNLGLQGLLSVVGHADAAFDFNIVLRHGLNKDHAAAQAWNNTNYAQAGGADDLNMNVEFHVSADEHE